MPVGGLNTTQTWDALLRELKEELRKWGVEDYHLPYKGDSERKGEVSLTMLLNGVEKTIGCSEFTHEYRGMERNLCALKEAIRGTRLADQRGILSLLAEVAQAALPALPAYEPRRVLGVSDGAGKSEVRSAYHAKVLYYHPDQPTGNRPMFDLVHQAGKDLGVA